MRVSLILLSLLILSSCSKSEQAASGAGKELIASSIYGGDRVEEGKWKSVVSISKLNYKDEVTTSFCTGTLIDKKTVLSAAHCFKRVKDYYLRSAAITLDNIDAKERSFIRIKNVRIHPDYTGENSASDFALIDLESEANVSDDEILPIYTSTDYEKGQGVELVGFGKTEAGTNGIKFEVSTQIREDLQTEFSAGGNGKDTCAGDSGGPLFIKNEEGIFALAGVTSRTPDDANSYCGDKTIYGKAAHAMKWIESERLIDKALALNSKESIDVLKLAAKSFRKYYKVYQHLGEYYLKFSMHDLAESALLKAIILRKDDKRSLDLLRELYSVTGDIDKEITILKRLLFLSPGEESYFLRLDFFGQTSEAEITRGLGRFRSGDIHMALADLELHRDNSRAAFVLSFCEFKSRNYEEAKIILNSIKEEIPFVDIRDSRGDSFLMAAVFEGEEEIVRELLRFKPNLKVKDSYGNNLAQIAWWAKEFSLVKLMVSLGVEWNANDYFQQFIYFIQGERISEVRFFLDMGVDINLVGPKGERAINLARETGNLELIKLIENYGKE
ncbi:putative protease [Halobacteriovorax marinus SJ]|uniref:Protease n=1 Tax=Halobacteriovorax marinus (strain ATCC BAA-682 / DSM 15412 / SJ) TaxID=862908 RepID=E1X5S7_HALMS|nr:trypsin-like serine protease [Halobacteriovorax marinus]CBW25644.1 putative protease [Halobacteriovorax marinus SJ]